MKSAALMGTPSDHTARGSILYTTVWGERLTTSALSTTLVSSCGLSPGADPEHLRPDGARHHLPRGGVAGHGVVVQRGRHLVEGHGGRPARASGPAGGLTRRPLECRRRLRWWRDPQAAATTHSTTTADRPVLR